MASGDEWVVGLVISTNTTASPTILAEKVWETTKMTGIKSRMMFNYFNNEFSLEDRPSDYYIPLSCEALRVF